MLRQRWSTGRRLAGALVVFLLVFGLLLVTAAPAVAASLIVSPALGVAGTSVQVVGAGFPASSQIALCWDNSGCADLGTAQSGSDDTFSVSVTIPPGALTGLHQIVACRDGSQPCATALITVLADSTTTSTTSTVTTTTTTTTAPTTSSTAVTSTTLFSTTTSTTAGVSPTTIPPITATTDASVTTTSTIPAVGPIGAPTTSAPPSPLGSDTGEAPPTTATTATGGDQGPAPAGVDGGGDLLVTASAQGGSESLVDRLRFWLGGIESGSGPSFPAIVSPPSEGILVPSSEEAASPPSQSVTGLAGLPLWSQVAALSAGVAALFFVIPLVVRWVWNLPQDE